MARPKKNIEEIRNIQIVFKINKLEYAQLLKLMEYSEKSGSEVIRQLVFKDRILRPRIPLVVAQTYTQLRYIGNNFNQLVRAVHQTKVSNIDRKLIIDVLNILEKLQLEILNNDC